MIALEHCPACDRTRALPRGFCPGCGGDVEIRAASGRGRVWSSTEVTRAPDEAFRALVPYTIALIDLEEGCRLMAHLDPGPGGPPAIGDAVTGAIETRAGRPLPVFRPL